MSDLHKEKYFGTPIDEWIERVPNELEIDSVGLWQIVPALMDSFGLSGEVLEFYTRRTIEGLIKRGAYPVEYPDSGPVRKDLLTNGTPDVKKIMAYIASLERPPTVEDVWFDLITDESRAC